MYPLLEVVMSIYIISINKESNVIDIAYKFDSDERFPNDLLDDQS